MDLAWTSVIGFFLGFGFGVGCALAVMYSIYTGGYRKAMEDSLREEKSERYLQLLPKVQAKLKGEQNVSQIPTCSEGIAKDGGLAVVWASANHIAA